MTNHPAHRGARLAARLSSRLLVPLLAFFAPLGNAEYADEWGPAVGAQLPVLEALDQDGNPQTLASLAGEQGLLLFLNRSADW